MQKESTPRFLTCALRDKCPRHALCSPSGPSQEAAAQVAYLSLRVPVLRETKRSNTMLVP